MPWRKVGSAQLDVAWMVKGSSVSASNGLKALPLKPVSSWYRRTYALNTFVHCTWKQQLHSTYICFVMYHVQDLTLLEWQDQTGKGCFESSISLTATVQPVWKGVFALDRLSVLPCSSVVHQLAVQLSVPYNCCSQLDVYILYDIDLSG